MPRTPASHPHPSPHRRRVSLAGQLFGVAIGPAAWIAQLVAGYGLSSYACYPGNTPLQAPPDGGEHLLLLAINLACLGLASAGLALSWSGWRRTRNEMPGEPAKMLETGEGRSRFLAICGVLSAAGFAIAILFNLPSALALPTCWSIPR